MLTTVLDREGKRYVSLEPTSSLLWSIAQALKHVLGFLTLEAYPQTGKTDSEIMI